MRSEKSSAKEHPILFSGPLVRALLDGRKTQTRRLLKPQPPVPLGFEWTCPYGQPGDRLWVRETWALEDCGADGERVIWRADRESAWRSDIGGRSYLASDYEPGRWRPSIHMPRWASRVSLEITDVRVERLQSISDVDAVAEGLEQSRDGLGRWLPGRCEFPSWAFRELWNGINGPTSWDANPTVWALTFRRLP